MTKKEKIFNHTVTAIMAFQFIALLFSVFFMQSSAVANHELNYFIIFFFALQNIFIIVLGLLYGDPKVRQEKFKASPAKFILLSPLYISMWIGFGALAGLLVNAGLTKYLVDINSHTAYQIKATCIGSNHNKYAGSTNTFLLDNGKEIKIGGYDRVCGTKYLNELYGNEDEFILTGRQSDYGVVIDKVEKIIQ